MDLIGFLTFISIDVPQETASGPVAATGTVRILDYTDVTLSGVTITVNAGGVTEGLDWNAATSNNATATSLKNALAALGDSLWTVAVVGPVVTITAATPGSAGNNIEFSSDPTTGLSYSPHGGFLGGGSD